MDLNYANATTFELENRRRSLAMVGDEAPGLTAGEAGQLLRRVLADEEELRRLRTTD
jgi:hypothetical protein